jgi:hypothetical protein
MDKEEFYEYVYSFYNGVDGIYKHVDATRAEVIAATRKLINTYGDTVCFDSVDRERVRDIILESRK